MIPVSVYHAGGLCKNGWTDRGPNWDGDFWGCVKHCIRSGFPSPHSEGVGVWCGLRYLCSCSQNIVFLSKYVELIGVLVSSRSHCVNSVTDASSQSSELWSLDRIRAYFCHVHSLTPVLTDEASRYLLALLGRLLFSILLASYGVIRK